MNSPILITGAPRSGTSVTAGIIHAGGAFGGAMRGANRYNYKGQFENKALVNINKGWLARHGYDVMGQRPVPGPSVNEHSWPSTHEVELLKVEVWNTLMTEGWDQRSPWFFKDPKTVWNWPLWMAAFPEAFWIIVRRDEEQTAKSCVKTGFMHAYNTVSSWRNWVETHYQRLSWIPEHTDKSFHIWPEGFIVNREYSSIRRVVDECGLEWNADVESFIERRLWRGADNKN